MLDSKVDRRMKCRFLDQFKITKKKKFSRHHSLFFLGGVSTPIYLLDLKAFLLKDINCIITCNLDYKMQLKDRKNRFLLEKVSPFERCEPQVYIFVTYSTNQSQS